MNEPHSFDLFLSFANADRAWVQGYLIPTLGMPRERIITHDDFRLGAPRVSEIERAVTTSHYSILILSPAYLADEWANFGEQLAAHLTTAEQSVRLIPLLKSECELPLRIDFRVRLDCADRANWERETARLRDLLNQPAPQPERIECPYPGMIPFRVEDARWFYGRAKEIDELVRRIRVQNFLFVIGPSGSGKSSLVFAGLVAELHKRQPNAWLVKTLRPGSDPLTALNDSTIALSHDHTNQLLIIDQFEELYAQSDKPTQTAFIARLKSLRVENRCTIVVTMRADFYPDLMNSDLWPLDPSERVEIAPLRGAALAEAIAKPAEQVGVYLEAGLVERLLADAADEPGVLPLVQETMVLLWDNRERRLLPLRAYEELGQGNLSGLAVAIATRADAVFAQLDESQRKIARRIFLRLVQFGEGRADTRRQQRVSALRASGDEPNEFDRTLKHLTEHRLLTLTGEEKDADRQVDIAHEALIAGWQRFRQWVNERREAEQTRRRLEDKAREWKRLGRGSAGLLDDVELREAENWLKSADATDLGYSETLPKLIDISRAEIQQAEREKEEARQRELAQAKALADEQRQRAETERRSRVRQRYFTLGLVVFLVVAIIAAGFAFTQYNYANQQFSIANQQRAEAQSRELASSAKANLLIDPERSIILALESISRTYTLEGEDALRQALGTSLIKLTLREHNDVVNTGAFSPDGKYIVTASNDNTARVWDVQSGRMVLVLRGHTDAVQCAVFSPDGKWVATSSSDKSARIWDAASGRELVVLRGHNSLVWNIAFSPDGKQVVTTSKDLTARVWNATTGREITILKTDREFQDAQFSPDGKQIAVAKWDGTARIYDAVTGRELQAFRGHTTMFTRSLAFSPDGKRIVTANDDQTARIWDVATGHELLTLTGHASSVYSATFSPDGKRIVTASWDQTARIWDSTNGREMIVLRGHTGSVLSAVFGPNGMQIITTSNDKSARLWDLAMDSELPTIKGDTQKRIYSATFSPDGKQILTAGADQTARIWDATTSKELTVLRGHTDTVSSVAFSSDGKHILTASWDQTARIWNSTNGRELIVLRRHTGPVEHVGFSLDNRQIVTASWDKTSRVWDAITGSEITILVGHSDVVSDAAFSPDGKRIVTASWDQTARVWDALTGKGLMVLSGHSGRVTSAVFGLDGKLIVTTSLDQTTRVWDATTGQQLMILYGHSSGVYSAAFSPDGKRIVTASWDQTARIWDATNGKELTTLHGHTGRLNSAVFSPDGKRIVTASDDGTARVFLTYIEDLVSIAQTRVTRDLACEERNTYLHENIICAIPTPNP